MRTIFTVIFGFTAGKKDPGRAAMRREITGIQIAGLSHEDGSGESFNIIGFCHDQAFLTSMGEKYDGYFEGYCRTDTRTGHIVFYER